MCGGRGSAGPVELKTTLRRLQRALGGGASLLGSLETLLEPPGALFGASWGALGGVLGPLGTLLGRLGGDPKQHKNDMPKKTKFASQPPYFLAPFWTPKSTKIEPKTSPNLRRFSRAKKVLSKSLLGPSWADLGAFWRPSWGSKYRCGIGRRSVW